MSRRDEEAVSRGIVRGIGFGVAAYLGLGIASIFTRLALDLSGVSRATGNRFSAVAFGVAVAGGVAGAAFGFWSAYHRDEPRDP